MEDMLLRCLAEGYEFLRTPRGLQLLAWASVVTSLLAVAIQARAAVNSLNESIKAANEFNSKNPRGRPPETDEAKLRQHERLVQLRRERNASLLRGVGLFTLWAGILPTAILVMVVAYSDVLFPGVPVLATTSGTCACEERLSNPTISQAMQFVIGDVAHRSMADQFATAAGTPGQTVALLPSSWLAIFMILYKLSLPSATGWFIAKIATLLEAFNGMSPRERDLKDDLVKKGLLPGSRSFAARGADASSAQPETS